MTNPASKAGWIVEDILTKIRSGELKPGDKLPSAKQLRDTYGVSSTPVREAINHLKLLGHAAGSPGIAVYVTDPNGKHNP